MSKNTDKLDRIIHQSSRWIIFGCVSPILYVLGAHLALYHELVSFDKVYWCALGIAAFICLVWWFWALRVIMTIGLITGKAKKDLTNAIDDVRMIKQDVEETNQLFKEIVKKSK